MADRTGIEWTDATWNPVTGCSKVSPGCAHCYAEAWSRRRGWTRRPWTPDNAVENVVLHPDRLKQPLSWRRPRRVFVCSMGDLFHERVPEEFIARVFAVMARASQHTFQVLTKRPERMASVLGAESFWFAVDLLAERLDHSVLRLPNIWLGTSIENRRFIDRADLLRQAPGAVRFVSAEPLLGALVERMACGSCWDWPDPECEECEGLGWWWSMESLDLGGIDWLIIGGESGARARPLRLEWVGDLIEAARDTGVAVFVKQLGSRWAREHRVRDLRGADPADWPRDLRVRELPVREVVA